MIIRNSSNREPGTWKRWVYGPTNTQGAVVYCAICGRGMSISGSPPFGSPHSISPDGSVSPSVVCPYEGCSWHVFIQLEGW